MNPKELKLISDILAHSAEEILSRNNESRVDVIIFPDGQKMKNKNSSIRYYCTI